MTATLVPPEQRRTGPPPWLRGVDPRDGIRVRVDGQTTLQTGDLPDPSYRVDVVCEDCTVDIAHPEALLRFSCDPDVERATGWPQPGPRFGWSVEAVLADGSRRRGGAQLWQVLAACCGDRDATEAVCEITRWVACEADEHARELRACSVEPARRAAIAWRERAEALRDALGRARELRRVPVRPLRDEFVRQCARGRLTAGQLARRLGWHWPRGSRRPDTARVLRRLGLIPDASARRAARRERLAPQQRELAAAVEAVSASMTYELAVEICRALRLDPADIGCL
jgi:hypothetical protein